jgi:hypothetical protein
MTASTTEMSRSWKSTGLVGVGLGEASFRVWKTRLIAAVSSPVSAASLFAYEKLDQH